MQIQERVKNTQGALSNMQVYSVIETSIGFLSV